MAESFSVKAILSAVDHGFSSTLKSASGALSAMGDKVKSGLGFGILTGIGQQAFTSLTNGAKELVSELNSSSKVWQTFEGNMKILGKNKKDINSVKKTLQDYATTTIYSSSDMASSYAQLAAVGIKSADKLVTGFGGLAGAAENPAQAMKTLSTQGVQMAAKPKVAWQDFKLMLEQTPAGISAVAREMGMTTSQLVTAVQDGEVKTEKFFDAVKKVGNSNGFTALATEYKSVDQAMDGLTETLSGKVMPAFDTLSKFGIKTISGITDYLDKIDGDAIASTVSSMLDKLEKFGTKAKLYIDAGKEAFKGVGSDLGDAFSAVKSSLGELNGEFGSTQSVSNFKSALQSVANAIKSMAGFVTEHSDDIAKLIKYLPAIAIGFKGLQVAKAAVPGITCVAKGLGSLFSKISGKSKKLKETKDTLEETGNNLKAVGEKSNSSSKSILNGAKSFALLGIGVLAVSLGFAILAQSAIALSNAGGLAIGVMAGLVIGVAALGIGMAVLLKSLAPMSSQLMPVATAFLAMGAAVILVGAGFALLAYSAISLANAGDTAISVMFGMVAAIALLAVGASVIGSTLTAGAVGFITFGAAILLVGVSALLVASALAIISDILPQLITYGTSGAGAISLLGASMLAFAVGAATAGVASATLAVGLTVAAVAIAAASIAVITLSVAIATLSLGVSALALSLALTTGVLFLLGLTLPGIGVNGTQAAAALLILSGSLTSLGTIAGVAGASLLALSVSTLAADTAVIAFGISSSTGAAGILIMNAALKSTNTSMKSIAKNAKTTQQSLRDMHSSISAVESGLDSLGAKAKTAMNSLISVFNNTAQSAESAGSSVGNGFSKGMQNELSPCVNVALSIASQATAQLYSGYSGAYDAGAYISLGFARGMYSQLSAIRSAAYQMAQAADAAVRAKAKIHSPSKVAQGLGVYWGEGYTKGLESMLSEAWRIAEEFAIIPQVVTPAFVSGYSGELYSDFEYGNNANFKIEVPLSIDGREFARAEADYMQDALDKKQIRQSRKLGRI